MRIVIIIVVLLLTGCAGNRYYRGNYPTVSFEPGTPVTYPGRVTVPQCRICVAPDPDVRDEDRVPGFGFVCLVGTWGEPLHQVGPVFKTPREVDEFCKGYEGKTT